MKQSDRARSGEGLSFRPGGVWRGYRTNTINLLFPMWLFLAAGLWALHLLDWPVAVVMIAVDLELWRRWATRRW